MRLNGEIKALKEPVALSDFLIQEGFSDKRIAVEKNGDIIPKSKMEHDRIQENDQIEVVTFVGGG